MKILYIANDRRAAQLASHVLRSVATDLSLAWVPGLADARHWIDKNRDVVTLIIEVESDSLDCTSFVSHARGLGITAPIIVVSIRNPAPPLSVLKTIADEVITKDLSFVHELPKAVRRALTAARPTARRRLRLLYAGDAALARECLGRPGGSIEVVPAVPGPGPTIDSVIAGVQPGQAVPFDLLFIEHGHPGVETLAILKDLAAREIHVPVTIVADWDEELAVRTLELGAGDYVIKSRASFRAVYFRLHRLMAHSALLDEQSRLRDAHAASVDRERATSEDLSRRLAEVQSARENAEQQMLAAVAALRQTRQDRLADAVVAAKELAQRESRFAAKLADATAETERIQQQLADRNLSLYDAEQRAEARLHSLSKDFARRQSDLETALSEELVLRRTIEAKLTNAEVARDTLERRMNEAISAVEEARQDRAADAAAAAQHLAQREAALLAKLGHAAGTQERLERRLTDVETALRCAEQRVTAEQHSARHQATERQAEFQAELGRQIASREALKQQLVDTKLALQRADMHHASRLAAAEARLIDANGRYDALLSEAAAMQDDLRDRLAAAEATLQAAVERHASEMSDADARLIENQEAAAAQLAAVSAATMAVESKLADSVAAFARLEHQAAADREAAAAEAALRQSDFEAELTRESTSRQALAEALEESEAEREREADHHASEIAAADARLADQQQQTETWLTDAAALADSLDAKVAAARAALERAEQQAALDRQTAADHASRQQAEFEERLASEVAARELREAQLRQLEAALHEAERRHASEMAAATANIAASREEAETRMTQLAEAREDGIRLEGRAREERAEWERRWADAQERIHHLQLDVERARQSLVEADERTQQQETAQRKNHADLQHVLDQARTRHEETLARLSDERATERAALEALIAERDAQLRDQAARKQTSDEAAAATLAAVQHRLQQAIATHDSDSRTIAQLLDRLKGADGELEATKRDRDNLRATAGRVAQLQQRIDDIRAEHRRQFDETPVSMCRCSRDGAVTQVNQALAGLLGYDTAEDVQALDFTDAVFDSGDELRWIVDRCLASRATESFETTWRKQDGSRIIVRLLAVPTAADSIDLVAEDVTRIRVLEEKLRNSQRMEAVARYGSEVAVTCHTLLRHVKQEGQQWLARMESDTARYQGELLLDEVTRAAGFLGQFAAYGNEQKNVPELVDVNGLLRDLEPVLKRVAGDNIEIVLPEASAPLNLDVEARRVERMLVNVAAYGRERMPRGGRLLIDVASVVVDREFVAKYPNVRPGPHVLLTVTELRGAARPDFSEAVPTSAAAGNATAPSHDNPGVDLGTLQALVSDCSGHLWMMAEPSGNMVLKIHLPRRVLDRSEPVIRPVRPRWIQRAFGARH